MRGVHVRAGVCPYEGLLWTAVADADGARFLQQVEVLLLELEVLHTSLQTHHLTELRPAQTEPPSHSDLNLTLHHVIKPNPYQTLTKPYFTTLYLNQPLPQ